MVLADTSVWVRHFRSGESRLAELLENDQVLMHPMVLGELACGNLSRRAQTLELLGSLSQAVLATDEECLLFIESQHLYGEGIGWVDAHLALSARFSSAELWTVDARLRGVVGWQQK